MGTYENLKEVTKESKEVFAVGAGNAAVYLADQSAGMYNMGNLLAAKLG